MKAIISASTRMNLSVGESVLSALHVAKKNRQLSSIVNSAVIH